MGNDQSLSSVVVEIADFEPFGLRLSKTGRRLLVEMPIPDTYPNTSLVKTIRERDLNTFVTINMVIRDDEFFINGFYVYASMYSDVATETERRMFKGSGKRILCAVIGDLYPRLSSPPRVIRLEAMGGSCYRYSERQKRHVLRGHNFTELCQKLASARETTLRRKIEALKSQLAATHGQDDRDDLTRTVARYTAFLARPTPPCSIEEVCSILENRKLISYYQTALGFRIVTDDFDSALMEASIADFAEKCSG